MKPTYASMRARALKAGMTVPIWTECQWEANKKARQRPLDLKKLLDLYDPGIHYNKEASWGPEDSSEWGKL